MAESRQAMSAAQRSIGALAVLVLVAASGLLIVQSCAQRQDARGPNEPGFDRHFTKPIDPADLGALLGSWDYAPGLLNSASILAWTASRWASSPRT